MLCGAALVLFLATAVGSVDVKPSENNITEGRSARKYADLPIAIPVGYFKSPDVPTYTDAAPDKFSDANNNLPTSFDDFVSSDASQQTKKPRYSYPQYYIAKGAPVKNVPPPMPPPAWKGDAGDDDASSPWMPSPTDMLMMMNMLKGMNGDTSDDMDDVPSGIIAKLQAEPIAVVLALLIPFTVLLASVLPTLATLLMNNGGEVNIPTITTVATGNSGRKLRSEDNASFVSPIMEAIETFQEKSASACIQRAFCQATGGRNGTEFRPLQKSLYKVFTFVDDHWLETFGMKELMEAMGSGNCEKIHCSDENRKKPTGVAAKEKQVSKQP